MKRILTIFLCTMSLTLIAQSNKDCKTPSFVSEWTSESDIIHTGVPCTTKVGINVSDPSSNLQVKGDGWFTQNLKIGIDGTPSDYKLEIGTNNFGSTTNGILIDHGASSLKRTLMIRDNQQKRFEFFSNGVLSTQISNDAWVAMEIKNSVGQDIFKIGHTGHVTCTKLMVRMVPFPDYVFEKEYNLMPLLKLEEYIQKNKHLPNMPTAKEVTEKGGDLGEINRILVEKVEEQTLHLIQHEKKIQALENTIQLLMKEVALIAK